MNLCNALLTIKSNEEIYRFIKDLFSPNEIRTIAERWHICQLLDKKELSYREIHKLTGTSLTTIGRVARFLRIESCGGFRLVLDKWKAKEEIEEKIAINFYRPSALNEGVNEETLIDNNQASIITSCMGTV
jgi:TrpR-related protein YerC/YecD